MTCLTLSEFKTHRDFSCRYGARPHYSKGYKHGVEEYRYGSHELVSNSAEEEEHIVAPFPPTKITYYAPVPSVPSVKYHG